MTPDPRGPAPDQLPGDPIDARETTAAAVGLVTVSYRSAEVLRALFDSLPAASSHPLHSVIADNASEAEIRTLAASRGAGYVPLDNPGYGAAVNAAVATLPAEIEWILVVNPDVVLHPGAIDVLVAGAQELPDIGSAGPRILDPDGSTYPSARSIPSLRTGVGHALLGRVWSGNPWSRRYLRVDELAAGTDRDAGWLSGACLLVRRSAFEEIGGFDEAYFMYFEDVDLGYRLGRHGFRNRYLPEAVVTHSGAHSTASESSRMIAAHHASARRFLGARYPGALLAPVRMMLSVGLRLRERRALRTARRAASEISVGARPAAGP